MKVISGGQTGADRAALDAAIDRDYPIAGACPKGRLAEDGTIPERYPLTEITGGYRARTRKNVQTGDGTLVFYRDELKGGTALTVSMVRIPANVTGHSGHRDRFAHGHHAGVGFVL